MIKKNYYLTTNYSIIVVFMALMGALFSCSENEHETYVGKTSVYFSEILSSDSIQYSFASGLKKVDTVKINVKIVGEAKDYDRFISYVVLPQSTAKAGLNYEDLEGKTILPSGKVEASIDVVVTNLDESLENSTVSLFIQLMPNDDFVNGYSDRQIAKVNITRQLVKPVYWDMPLSLYYGSYSKVKHRLCLQHYTDRFLTLE